jgi:hypothetical protein
VGGGAAGAGVAGGGAAGAAGGAAAGGAAGADAATGAMVDDVDVATGAMGDLHAGPPRPSLAGRPRLPARPGSPGRRRVRSHAAMEGRRRASKRSRGLGRLGRFGPRAIIAGVAGLAGLAGLLAATSAHLLSNRTEGPAGRAASPGGGCAARYVANPAAGGAFTAEVAITNTGAARLDEWSLEFALPGGQRITDARGIRWDQRGEAVTLRGATPLEAGHTQTLSLTGTSTSAPVAPTRITLDGASCTPGVGGSTAVPPATPS